MLDERKLKESKINVGRLVRDKDIIKGGIGKFVEFFLDNARNSIDSASLLFNVSTNKELKESAGFPGFNGYLWVINASYYSMFYTVRALLESEGIKIKTEQSVHKVVFDVLVYYFYLNGKIEKIMVEEFQEAGEEASEVLAREKAKELVENYLYEKGKRGRFTYEMGEVAMKNKAETSLERARKFNEEIRKMLEFGKEKNGLGVGDMDSKKERDGMRR